MINVPFLGSSYKTVGQAGNFDTLPVISQQTYAAPINALQDLLLIFVVSVLTGTSPTAQLLVEQLIGGTWQTVQAFTAVSAVGTYTYIARGNLFTGVPHRFRVVDGGTVTQLTFTLSKWAAALVA